MEVSFDKIESEMSEIYDLFTPRATWASPTMSSDSGALHMMATLWKLQSCGHLSITYEKVSRHSFSRYDRPRDDYGWRMSNAAARRRGNDDLKDHTWSAYLHLQDLSSDEELAEEGDGIPGLYFSIRRGEAIIAGNVAPDRILRWMAESGATTLNIVGMYYQVQDGQCPADVYKHDELGMVKFAFTEQGHSALRLFYRREARRVTEALNQLYGRHR